MLNRKYELVREKGEQIYWLHYEAPVFNEFAFSFDKKTIYNLYSDWGKLNKAQKELLVKERPTLASLVSWRDDKNT